MKIIGLNQVYLLDNQRYLRTVTHKIPKKLINFIHPKVKSFYVQKTYSGYVGYQNFDLYNCA